MSALDLNRLESGTSGTIHQNNQQSNGLSNTSQTALCALQGVKSAYDWSHRFYFNHTNRTVRDLVKLSLAMGLSTIGSGVSSDPRVRAFLGISAVAAAWLGGALSGGGNGLSFWLSKENDQEQCIAALERQVRELMAAKEQEKAGEIV